jgi:hypothetical protein
MNLTWHPSRHSLMHSVQKWGLSVRCRTSTRSTGAPALRFYTCSKLPVPRRSSPPSFRAIIRTRLQRTASCSTEEAGISRKRTVRWNIVPWYIGDGRKIRPANRKDVTAGLDPLRRLLDLLPNLRAVVLQGNNAKWARPAIELWRPALAIFECPHPSPLFINNAPGNRERILSVLREVAAFLNRRAPAC